MNLIFSSRFEEDFAEVVSYFAAKASLDVATSFEENTYDLIRLLQLHPEIGRSRTDLKPPGLRSFGIKGFERYLLFYQVKGEDLVLLRLRYGGMNLAALFGS